MQKVLMTIETGIIVLSIHWQPVMGIAASICGCVYYIAMLKLNVVDKKYEGSWKLFIKSFLKIK